jgi:hypothetical protein
MGRIWGEPFFFETWYPEVELLKKAAALFFRKRVLFYEYRHECLVDTVDSASTDR